MNLARKLELTKQAVASMIRHDDADEAVLSACVAQLQSYIEEETKAACARRDNKRAQAIAALNRSA
jgi:hypothetical protein